MTPFDNFRMLVSGAQPQWIPFTLDVGAVPGFTKAVQTKFEAETGATDPAEYFDFDFRTLSVPAGYGGDDPAKYFSDLPEGTKFDTWGVGHWAGGAEDTYEMMFPPLATASTPGEIMDFPVPVINSKGIAEQVEQFHRRGYPVAAYAGSIYEWSWWLRGMENFMVDLVANPEIAEAIVEKVTDYVLDLALESTKCGIDVLAFYDDAGHQTGMQISPTMWRQIIKPAWQRIINQVRSSYPQAVFFLHSCGNIYPIISDVIEVGFDILHPIQPECMNAAEIKHEFEAAIIPCATIGAQRIFAFGTAEDVKRETMRLMDEVGFDRRCILCPSNIIQPETPWDNILAFAETARNYRGGRTG